MARRNTVTAPTGLPKDFQAEDDHRQLTRAFEIQQDPGRMADVGRYHRKQTKALTALGSKLRGLNLRGLRGR